MKEVESPGFIGFEAMKAIVVGDVFLPIHPLSSVYDKKEPLLISRLNETKFEMPEGLLVICRMVLSAVFVDVTVTVSDEAYDEEIAKLESMMTIVSAKRMCGFNNTFLNERTTGC